MKKQRAPAKKEAHIRILWREEDPPADYERARAPGSPVDVPLAFIASLPEETIQLDEFPIQVEGSGVGFYVHVDDGYKFVLRGMTPEQRQMVYG